MTNYLFIMKSSIKIITHVPKLIQKSVECFSSESNAHRICLNLHIKIYLNFNILGVHRSGAGGSMHVCHAAGPGSIPGRDKFPG